MRPGDGGVELVDIIVDALVHGLHPAVHVDLPLVLLGNMAAGEGIQLDNQGVCLLQHEDS